MRMQYFYDWHCAACTKLVRTHLSSPATVNRFADMLIDNQVVCAECLFLAVQNEATPGVLDSPLASSAACVLGEEVPADRGRRVLPVTSGCIPAEPVQEALSSELDCSSSKSSPAVVDVGGDWRDRLQRRLGRSRD